jgi:hypothetical protein
VSGRPDEDGAAEVVGMLDAIDALDGEIARHERAIEAMRPTYERLAAAKEERRAIDKRLRDKLDAMDCDQRGNYGWSSRFAWLLGAVVRRARVGS